MKIHDKKNSIKVFLVIVGVLIVTVILFYANSLVEELKEKTGEDLRFRIQVLEENLNKNPGGEVTFVFENIIKNADFPIVYSDAEHNILYWKNIDFLNENEFSNLDTLQKQKLTAFVKEIDEKNSPIPIRFNNVVLGYYHYGDSPIIKKLQILPYIEILMMFLFIGLGYIGFSSLKRSEKNLIWAGMAKETAHQLGTPMSSISGWFQLLREQGDITEEIASEIARDIDRLNMVSERFSQIGSKPALNKEKISPIIKSVVDYYEKRFSKISKNDKANKKIEFRFTGIEEDEVYLNRTLLIWAVENLIKNSIDALDQKQGIIETRIFKRNEFLNIEITDNGKGIDFKNRNKIFEAGFSTKKRGWGLGLSLSRRIIEEYHNGKISLINTKSNEGTTFRIQLKEG